MATDDRKKRIMEHLSRSSGSMEYISPKKIAQPSTPSASISPTPTFQGGDRKANIMEHLARSSGDTQKYSMSEGDRKRKVMDHLRLSQG
jgi:hypothetical protein